MLISQVSHVSTSNLPLPHTYLVPNDMGLDLHFSHNGCVAQDPQTKQIIGQGIRLDACSSSLPLGLS